MSTGVRQAARQVSDSPFALAGLGFIYAKAGEKDRARGILQELAELSGHRYVCGYSVGLIHAALGEKEQALDWLEKANGERSD
jgi:Flp pilus assembly protein TadD